MLPMKARLQFGMQEWLMYDASRQRPCGISCSCCLALS